MRIYPNPSVNHVNIISKTEIETIDIFDVTGKLVLKIESPNKNIDISQLAKGLYMLRLYSEKGVTNKRIVKQ